MTERVAAPPLPEWITAQMPPFMRYRIEARGMLVHTMEIGDGPAVVMVHGNPTWGFLYRKVAAELADAGYRIVIPDLIGLGLSDRPASTSEHRLENHIDWFAGWLEAMDLGDITLVVQDWGGAIGVGGAATHGGVLSGLVVLNTVLGPPRPGFKPTTFHRLSQMPVVSDLLFRALRFPVRGMWFAQGDKRSIRGRVAAAYRHPLTDTSGRATPLALARMVPDSMDHPSIAPLHQVADFVSDYDGPAAIVWGDADPVLGRVRNHMARSLPQADVSATSAGHFLQEEVPGEIARAIRTVRG